MPYYLLAQAWSGALRALWPMVPLLTSVRLLSAAAGCLTVVVLYLLVARNVGRLAGLLSGVLLVSLPGFDRMAQEGRGYTLLALAATLSWLMWDRWLRPGMQPGLWASLPKDIAGSSRTGIEAVPAGVAYLASLAALGLIHTFGLFQWPAQLLATLVTRPGRPWRRSNTFWMTTTIMVLAASTVAVQTLASITHGTGSQSPNAARLVNLTTISTQVVRGAFLSTKPLVIALVLALALIGLVGARKTRPFAFAMLIWLLAPLVLELGLSALKTNLFRPRYWVADLPPLAALAGLGLMLLARAVANLIGHSSPVRATGGHPLLVAARAVVTVVVLTLILGVQGTVQASEQKHLRALHGHHGEDLAKVLRVIDQTTAKYPHLKVLISSGPASGILGAVRPALEADNPLRTFDPAARTVYTVPSSQASVRAAIRHSRPLLWIFRGVPLNAHSAGARIPHGLAGLHMHVIWALPAGNSWTAILLQPRSGRNTTTITAARR